MNSEITKFIEQNAKIYAQIWDKIQQYDRIAIFRHQSPDFDALGSQIGLTYFLREHFPNKEIYMVGENHVTMTPRMYPVMDTPDDAWFEEEFLAICVDTGNTARISDSRFQKAEFIIKMDHHPNVEPYGAINLVCDELAAAAELITSFLFSTGLSIPRNAATMLYSGIVGDSGRFLFSSTTPHTFAISEELLKTGFSMSRDVYQKMYRKQIEDLRITAYVLGNFKVTPGGVAYYILPQDVLDDLHITVERGKENLGLFSNIEEIACWCSITADQKKGTWKVSIRSKEVPINQVAAQFRGGGHAQASGATLESLDELPALLEALDQQILSHD